MTDDLVVLMGGRPAGKLRRHEQGRIDFEYDDAYRASSDATPLSLSMPLQRRAHPDAIVKPWLWGLLPDNEKVLRRWAREFHVSAASPFALLSTPIGEDCAGAVRFVAQDRLDAALTREGSVEWLTDADVAQRLRDLRADGTSWLGETFTGRWSLAGAQSKLALLEANGRWGEPSGATPTTHILKPAVVGLDDHDLNEHLSLQAARGAGLTAARTSIERFEDQTAVVVNRYDRLHQADGTIVRVHQEDLCQALGVDPSRKYQNDGGPSPKTIATLLREVMPASVAEPSVRRFADALAFNWLIAGTDAHAKNHSLLLAANQVRVAPLYDVASILPYGIDERKAKLAMKLGSSYEVWPRIDRWGDAARDLRLDADELRHRVLELAAVVPDAFADAAATEAVRALDSPLPAKLTDLVADRARRCAALVAESVSSAPPARGA